MLDEKLDNQKPQIHEMREQMKESGYELSPQCHRFIDWSQNILDQSDGACWSWRVGAGGGEPQCCWVMKSIFVTVN